MQDAANALMEELATIDQHGFLLKNSMMSNLPASPG